MRKLLLILLSTIILTSCSAFDNQANNQEVKDIKKQAVYDAFSNYSSVSNKSYDKFALPQSIEISEIKNVSNALVIKATTDNAMTLFDF